MEVEGDDFINEYLSELRSLSIAECKEAFLADSTMRC